MSDKKKNKRTPIVHMHPDDKDKFADAIADKAIEAMNEHRKAKGLPPLKK